MSGSEGQADGAMDPLTTTREMSPGATQEMSIAMTGEMAIVPNAGEMRTIPGSTIRNVNRARVWWRGAHTFDAGRDDDGATPNFRIDAGQKEGPGPVDVLLTAMASCTAVDVVDILAKRRTPVESLEVGIEAARAKAVPAKVIGVLLTYRMRGAGIERIHAERAIELAVTKYCTVRDSLDPAIPVNWRLELE